MPNRIKYETLLEACHYVIEPAEDTKWDPLKTELVVYFNASSAVQMYVYAGNDRRNASAMIESNLTMVVGAPIRIPFAYQGAVLVMMIDGTDGIKGSATFSYKLQGIPYNWYQAPFINLHVAWYYLFLIALVVAACLVV